MKRSPYFSNLTKFDYVKGAGLAAAMLIAASVAHGQNSPYYSTNFDGTDYNAGVATSTTYASPATPTDPLAGQNGWLSNDMAQTPTSSSNQLGGDSNYVGPGPFQGQAGALGGVYRTPAASASPSTPDVVPRQVVSTLYRPFTLGSTTAPYTFNTDLLITQSGVDGNGNATPFTNHDSFAFTLRDSAGTALASVNFIPSTTGPNAGPTVDAVNYTVGTGAPVSFGAAIKLGSSYTLTVNVNPTTDKFSASLTPLSAGPTVQFATNVPFAGATDAASVTQVAATWTLANTTQDASGAYTAAGDNTLFFDNYSIAAVPEPSTYVASGLIGLVGLAGIIRRRRKVAA